MIAYLLVPRRDGDISLSAICKHEFEEIEQREINYHISTKFK